MTALVYRENIYIRGRRIEHRRTDRRKMEGRWMGEEEDREEKEAGGEDGEDDEDDDGVR